MTVTEFDFCTDYVVEIDVHERRTDARTPIQHDHSIVVLMLTGLDQQQQQVEWRKNKEMNKSAHER